MSCFSVTNVHKEYFTIANSLHVNRQKTIHPKRLPMEEAHLLEHLSEIECVAEDILTCRREIIDLERQKHKTREAVRALEKEKPHEKIWLCAGKMFLKVENKTALKIVSKDFDELDREIVNVRAGLKPKVNKLRDLENKPELKGFDLCSLSPSEMKAVQDLL